MKKTFSFRLISASILVSFLTTGVVPSGAYAQALNLPAPGTMVSLTPAYMPVLMKGVRVHPENPLLFDFILDSGKSSLKIESPEFKAESHKLIKYFLASLTIKEDDLWVNLSPYEKDRMITDELGKTELGRDMLAQDYILKQLTASLIYPEKDLGKAFWDRVYTKAREQFGTTDIPVDTFNKVWITADKAKVLERNNVAYVVGAHLKVMLESDYEAMSHQKDKAAASKEPSPLWGGNGRGAQELAKQVIRDVVIPEIEKEVNEGQNFAMLRQMFYSMILASWYKRALRDALLNQVYSNKGKTSGVLSDDPAIKDKIYTQYLEAYKKGVFNYIKEDLDAVSQQPVPRKYFSGGLQINARPDVEDQLVPGEAIQKDGAMALESVQMAVRDAAMSELEEDFRNEIDGMSDEQIAAVIKALPDKELRWIDRPERTRIFNMQILVGGPLTKIAALKLVKLEGYSDETAPKGGADTMWGAIQYALGKAWKSADPRVKAAAQKAAERFRPYIKDRRYTSTVLLQLLQDMERHAKALRQEKLAAKAELLQRIQRSIRRLKSVPYSFEDGNSKEVVTRQDGFQGAYPGFHIYPDRYDFSRVYIRFSGPSDHLSQDAEGFITLLKKEMPEFTIGHSKPVNIAGSSPTWQITIDAAQTPRPDEASGNKAEITIVSEMPQQGKWFTTQSNTKYPHTNVIHLSKAGDRVKWDDEWHPRFLNSDLEVDTKVSKIIHFGNLFIFETKDQQGNFGMDLYVATSNGEAHARDVREWLGLEYTDMMRHLALSGDIKVVGNHIVIKLKGRDQEVDVDLQKINDTLYAQENVLDSKVVKSGLPYASFARDVYDDLTGIIHALDRFDVQRTGYFFRKYLHLYRGSLNGSTVRSMLLGWMTEIKGIKFVYDRIESNVGDGWGAFEGSPTVTMGSRLPFFRNTRLNLKEVSQEMKKWAMATQELLLDPTRPDRENVEDLLRAGLAQIGRSAQKMDRDAAQAYKEIPVNVDGIKLSAGQWIKALEEIATRLKFLVDKKPYFAPNLTSVFEENGFPSDMARNELRTLLTIMAEATGFKVRSKYWPPYALNFKLPLLATVLSYGSQGLFTNGVDSSRWVGYAPTPNNEVYDDPVFTGRKDRMVAWLNDVAGKIQEMVPETKGKFQDVEKLISTDPSQLPLDKNFNVVDGGIDLNAKKMDLDVAKDGKGVEMKFDPAMVAEFRKGDFTGVEGVVLKIVPIENPLALLGL